MIRTNLSKIVNKLTENQRSPRQNDAQKPTHKCQGCHLLAGRVKHPNGEESLIWIFEWRANSQTHFFASSVSNRINMQIRLGWWHRKFVRQSDVWCLTHDVWAKVNTKPYTVAGGCHLRSGMKYCRSPPESIQNIWKMSINYFSTSSSPVGLINYHFIAARRRSMRRGSWIARACVQFQFEMFGEECTPQPDGIE